MVPGYPETVRLPDAVCGDIDACRETFLVHVGDQKTLKEWKTTSETHLSNLSRLLRQWDLDHLFITQYAGPALLDKLRKQIVHAFPGPCNIDDLKSGDEMAKVKAGLASFSEKLEKIRTSPLALAIWDAASKDITWAASHVQHMLEYEPLTASQLQTVTSYQREVVVASENLLCTIVHEMNVESTKKGSLKALLCMEKIIAW